MDPYTNTISGSPSAVDGASDASIYITFANHFFRFKLDEDDYATVQLIERDGLLRTMQAALAEYDGADQAQIDLSFSVTRQSDNNNSIGVKILKIGEAVTSSLVINGANVGQLDVEHLRNFVTLLEGAPTSA